MRKIAIIGNGGAGKSTLAKEIGSIVTIPVYHLDAIFWKPGWTPIQRDALIEEQNHILNKETWIIDGNYGSTMDLRLQIADTVIFLHYPTFRCLYGNTKRRIKYRNITRPDMGKDCPEKLDWEFFQWILQFNKIKTPAIYERLADLQDTNILIFKKPKELRAFLNNVRQETKLQKLV
ncbi:DNA topology modulation protein [Virgibacillus byunsanensis]|uniref:DNA topology modulation protein n=1 Tax=Virgibacillus byunsanensis TaxID=570945 RepID=A0ABW3LHJ5_9BACI